MTIKFYKRRTGLIYSSSESESEDEERERQRNELFNEYKNQLFGEIKRFKESQESLESRIELYKKSKKKHESEQKRKAVIKPLTPYQIARINKSLGKPSAKDEFIIKIRERDVDF